MTKNVLKTEEICAIIRECGRSGVSEFSYGGMKVAFALGVGAHTQEEIPLTPQLQAQVEEVAGVTGFKDEYKLVKDELDQLVIEDPLAFEEALRRGELKDERA